MRVYTEPLNDLRSSRRERPIPASDAASLVDSTLDSAVSLLLTGSLQVDDSSTFALFSKFGATPFFYYREKPEYPAEKLSLPIELTFAPGSLQPEGIFAERFMHSLFNRGELSAVRYAVLNPHEGSPLILGVAGTAYRIETSAVETEFDELIHCVRTQLATLRPAFSRWRESLNGETTLAALANRHGAIVALSPSLGRQLAVDGGTGARPHLSDLLAVGSLGQSSSRISMAPVPAESPLYTLLTWERSAEEPAQAGESDRARAFLFHALKKKLGAILTAATYRPFAVSSSRPEDAAMLQLIQTQAEEMQSIVSTAEQAFASEPIARSSAILGSLLESCAAERRAMDQLITVNFADEATRELRIAAPSMALRALFASLFNSVRTIGNDRSIVDVTVRHDADTIELRIGLPHDDDAGIDPDWLSVARTVGEPFGARIRSNAAGEHTSSEIIVTLP